MGTRNVPELRAIDQRVGAIIRERREQIGMTQKQLGAKIGVSFRQISKYESGEHSVPAGNFAYIADALGCTVGYFYKDFPGQENPTPKMPTLLSAEHARLYIYGSKLPASFREQTADFIEKISEAEKPRKAVQAA